MKQITPVPEAAFTDNVTPGISKKPDACYASCPLAYKHYGIVQDYVPAKPKIAVMFPQPGKEDVTERQPASSGYGRYFFAAIAQPLRLNKEDMLLTHALRCYSDEYPISVDATKGEQACRQWDHFKGDRRGEPVDGGLVTWNPNIFICTFSVDKMIEIGAYYELAYRDFEKALRFADAGYRPMVLMGTEAMALVAPWLSGGIKRWRGHWWEGSWRWNTTRPSFSTLQQIKGFAPATIGYQKRKNIFAKKTKIKELKQLPLL